MQIDGYSLEAQKSRMKEYADFNIESTLSLMLNQRLVCSKQILFLIYCGQI